MDPTKTPYSELSYNALEKQLEEIQKELADERKKSSEDEIKFESFFKNAPIPYYSLNIDGYFIEVNQIWLSALGYSIKDVIGEYYGNFLHPESKEWFKNKFPEFKKMGHVHTSFKIRHKKGHYLDIDVFGNIIKNFDGNFIQTHCIFHNITQSKKAQEELMLKNIVFETSVSANSISDKNGILTHVNKAFLNFWAYENSCEVLGKSIAEFIKYEHDSKKIINALNREGHWSGEYIALKKDGTEFIALANASAIKDANNNFIGYQSSVVDITKRIIAEKKLKLNEQRLNALVELGQMTNKSDKYIYDFTLNKAIELTQSTMGFLGFVNEDESVVHIYRWSETAMEKCTMKNINMDFIVAEAGIWGDVIRNREALILNDYSQPIPNKKGIPLGHVQIKNYLSIPAIVDGKIVAMLSVANKEEDYTQSDVNQGTLLINGMYRFMAQRKEKEELIKAKHKAEESDRLKSAFLANMSHEIRTPMNGILGFTELLQDVDLSVEDQYEYVNNIKISSDRLLNTVNDIIEISKIESGEVNLSVDDVNLINHLETLVAFFTPEIEKKGLKISIDNEINGLIATIQTDKTKLNAIFSILIKNSIKYTYGGFIKVGFKPYEGQLLFYCQDSGIGIPKNRHQAIFNRFEQADIEDKQVHEGSGLGLAIVKSYVEMLNGTIWVESEENKGSTFYVALPYTAATSKQNDTSFKRESSDSEKKNINVLVVEDEEVSSMYLSIILNGFVQNVRSVKNGVEAVEACKNETDIDLVLMDLKMPKMNGFEATKRIREFNKDVVIIAQTAYAFQQDKQKALAAGCNDYVSKPIAKYKLKRLVNKYF